MHNEAGASWFVLLTQYYWQYRLYEEKMGEACDKHGGKRNARRDLVKKTEEKRRLERLGLIWEVNIEMGPKIMEWKDVEWIHLADVKNKWRDLLNTLMKFGFHKMRVKFLTN